MMLGYAYQKGLLPLSAKALLQAIEVNGVSIKMNAQAFQLGRLAAADPARLKAMMALYPESETGRTSRRFAPGRPDDTNRKCGAVIPGTKLRSLDAGLQCPDLWCVASGKRHRLVLSEFR